MFPDSPTADHRLGSLSIDGRRERKWRMAYQRAISNILAKAPLDCNNGILDIYILHYGILLTFLSKATCNHSFTHSHTDVGVYYAG